MCIFISTKIPLWLKILDLFATSSDFKLPSFGFTRLCLTMGPKEVRNVLNRNPKTRAWTWKNIPAATEGLQVCQGSNVNIGTSQRSRCADLGSRMETNTQRFSRAFLFTNKRNQCVQKFICDNSGKGNGFNEMISPCWVFISVAGREK